MSGTVRFACLDLTGRVLGHRYTIERRIATGGMSQIFSARDARVARSVVVKVPLPGPLTSLAEVTAFQEEIRRLAALQHPAIVPVLDADPDGPTPYLVLPYLRGGSLAERIAAGPEHLSAVVPWLRSIAAALDHVHHCGLRHGDVKPRNILFDADGAAYLTDFGVSGPAEPAREFGIVPPVGSSAYFAPEVLHGVPSAASDRYSLAVVAYEALTGRLPGVDEDEGPRSPLARPELTAASLARRIPAATPALVAALRRGLAEDPSLRFPSCVAFVDALVPTDPDIPGVTRRTPITRQHGPRRLVRRCALPGIAVGLALITGWGAGFEALRAPFAEPSGTPREAAAVEDQRKPEADDRADATRGLLTESDGAPATDLREGGDRDRSGEPEVVTEPESAAGDGRTTPGSSEGPSREVRPDTGSPTRPQRVDTVDSSPEPSSPSGPVGDSPPRTTTDSALVSGLEPSDGRRPMANGEDAGAAAVPRSCSTRGTAEAASAAGRRPTLAPWLAAELQRAVRGPHRLDPLPKIATLAADALFVGTCAVRAGERHRVEVTGDESGDLDLYVVGSDGTCWGRDDGPTDRCAVEWSSPSDAPVWVVVVNFGPVQRFTTRTGCVGRSVAAACRR